MAVPKHRASKTRGRLRRTHFKIFAKATTTCENCGAVIRPHRACLKCGFYKGKKVVQTVEENKPK